MAQWQDESISASNENHHEKKSENIQRRFKGPDLIRFYALLQDSGLTKSEYIRRKLLDEPLCPREDRDALAMNTVELIRLKNEVAKLSLSGDKSLPFELRSQIIVAKNKAKEILDTTGYESTIEQLCQRPHKSKESTIERV